MHPVIPRRAATRDSRLMTTVLKISSPSEFLSLVPNLLGFHPVRSLVTVPLSRGRNLGALRVDLPPEDDIDACERLASSVVGLVCRVADADAMVAVIYTDASVATVLPYRRLAEALSLCSDSCGLPLTDVLTVATDGWGSQLDPLHPDGGRPLAELEPTDAAGLPAVAGDQTAGAMLPDHDAADAEATASAVKALRAAISLIGDPDGPSPSDRRARRLDPAALQAACALVDLPTLAEAALGWDAAHLPPMRAAMMSLCLSRPALRDVALVCWASDLAGGQRALEAQQEWEDGAEYPVEVAMIMWGEGPRPDPSRLEAALTIARHVAAVTRRSDRPGPLAACAWLSWALGRSTHAERYATEALAIDPEHVLGEIVLSFVTAGHLPDWAFTRRSA